MREIPEPANVGTDENSFARGDEISEAAIVMRQPEPALPRTARPRCHCGLLDDKVIMCLAAGTCRNASDLEALTVISEQDDCVAGGSISGAFEALDIKARVQIK